MKRIISLILSLTMMLTFAVGCTPQDVGQDGNSNDAQKLACYDENGRLVSVMKDETISDFSGVEPAELLQKDRALIRSKAYVQTMFDSNKLYIKVSVTDSEITSDSVEIYLDRYWDKALSYQADDIRFEIDASGKLTVHNGSEADVVATYEAVEGGYTVLAEVALGDTPFNDMIMGFDVRVNDYDKDGALVGRLNLFDRTDSVNDDPSSFGELILKGEVSGTPSDKRVEALIQRFESEDLSVFGGSETVTAAISKLKSVLDNPSRTAKEVNEAMENAHDKYYNLVDASAFPEVKDLKTSDELPDPFEMLNGDEMKTKADWEARRKEIRDMYQYYMYGVWRDGSDEIVTYDYKDGALTIYIERISTGAKTQISATVKLPDDSLKAPSENGFPVIVGMHAGISEDTAVANGFATATLDWFAYGVASDDTKRKGAFYDLYPYGNTWQEQTGVLMAWSWGCSKILDALEAGLGEELGIDPTKSIVTGVSRWGKAASVAGAFDERFTMVAPSCSGAGGLAMFRYTSEGNTYDFSSKGASASYRYGQNEPLGSLQSSGEVGWFNNNFKAFKSPEQLPFDQYMLASLVADPERYMFIIGSCIYEDWVNAPAMWYTYLASKPIYEYLGAGDNIKINIHKEGHAVIAEDVEYMAAYFYEKVYGIKSDMDLSVLDTSVFALEQNVDEKMEGFTDDWILNYMLD